MRRAEGAAPLRGRAHRRGDVRLTLALLFAIVAAVLPLFRVVAPAGWVFTAGTVTIAILATGALLRHLRTPAIVTTIAEAFVWMAGLTLAFFSDTAILGLIPTPATFADLPWIADSAMQQIVFGIAPVAPDRGLSVLAVAGVGALAVLLDHTVLTARMPLLAAIALVAVWLIPALSVPASVDIAAFVLLAAALLLLIRSETRSRERAMISAAAPSSGAPARGAGAVLAAALATVAIVATVVVAPELPRPAPRVGIGTGPATTINANLELGDDLRRPAEVEVLTVRTNAPSAPYLRAATLSVFDGDVWEPDRDGTVPLTPEALGAVSAGPDVRVTEYQTTVAVTQLTSTWLPVPGPAVRVDDLDGAWDAMPANRTVVAADAGTQGQEYLTTTHVVRPTLEQIQAAGTVTDGLSDEVAAAVTAVPDDIPPVIAETALEVTADEVTDYDRLAALQRWFRGSEFTYSLEAPVDDGFDGSGADAIADFLDVKAGYCVHYASAFALMARTLDMPSRIVVGYLPGSATGESIDGQSVASVSSSQLHAWPEVHFAGIGWVAFEPTNSLGAPPTFTRSTQPVPNDGGQDVTPAPAPVPTASAAPVPTAVPAPTAAGEAADDMDLSGLEAAAPWVGGAAGLIVLLLLPGLAGVLRRRSQLAAAGRGTVVAAWHVVRDAALDTGMRVPDAESPRALGARIAEVPGMPVARVRALVEAVERASYGRGGAGSSAGSAGRSAAGRVDAEAIRAGLLAASSPRHRLRAHLAPRSLFARLSHIGRSTRRT